MAAITQLPVQNALTGSLPCEGAKVLAYVMDFSITSEFDFDLTQQYQAGQFSSIQGAFIDNSANNSTLEIVCNVTEQPTIVPANSQGWFVFLMTAPPRFVITSAGNVQVYIGLINFYVPPCVWAA